MRATKRVTFFAAYNKNRPEAFLTIALKKNDAFDYIKRMLTFENFNHFQRWCEIDDHDIDDDKTIDLYFDTVITDAKKNDFAIAKISYAMSDIVAMMRMFGQCVPLGCSFETAVEEAYYEEVLEKSISQFM